MSGDARALFECPGDRPMTPDHIAIRVRRPWQGQAGMWSVFRQGLGTGHHKKAPVCCPCNRLAAVHGAPLMHCSCYSTLLM